MFFWHDFNTKKKTIKNNYSNEWNTESEIIKHNINDLHGCKSSVQILRKLSHFMATVPNQHQEAQ